MKQKFSIILCISIFLCLCIGGSAISDDNVPQGKKARADELRKMLYQKEIRKDAIYPYFTPVHKMIFDMGESALPVLQEALEDERYNNRIFILNCISMIGGEKAKKLLQDLSKRSKDNLIERALCLTMSTTGTGDDKIYLNKIIKTAPEHKDWWSAISALISLWVLDPKGSVEIFGDKKAKDIPPDIVNYVNRELRGIGGAKTPQAVIATEEDKVILALFKNGIVGIDKRKYFAETEAKRTWKYEEGSWVFTAVNFKPPVANKFGMGMEPAFISFRVHIATDKTRVMAMVIISYGNMNSSEYLYILNFEERRWNVVSVIQTNIS
jgi:hypothetical protein